MPRPSKAETTKLVLLVAEMRGPLLLTDPDISDGLRYVQMAMDGKRILNIRDFVKNMKLRRATPRDVLRFRIRFHDPNVRRDEPVPPLTTPLDPVPDEEETS